MIRPRLLFLFISLFYFTTSHSQVSSKDNLWLAPVSKPKLYGLQNSKGEITVKAQYEFLSETDGGGWITVSGGKYGVINSKGNWLIKPDFETIVQFVNGKAVAGKKSLNKEPRGDDGMAPYDDSLVYYGVIDLSGTWVVEPVYSFLRLCEDGSSQYTDKNEKFGFLNPDGSVMIRAQYQYASRMTEGVAVIAEPLKASVNPYETMESAYEMNGGDYYIIDRTGKKINQDPYPLIREFSNGRAAFNKDGLWKNEGYYSASTKLIGGKWGFLDASGKEIIEAKYDYVYDFKNGKAKVRSGLRIFWIDKDGKECAAPSQLPQKEFTVYCEPGFFGYIDVKGNWAIAPQYYSAKGFSEGFAAVMTLRACDMDCGNPEIDAEENENVSSTYSRPLAYLLNIGNNYNDNYEEHEKELADSTRMADSISSVNARRLYGYIDATGNMILPAKYEVALPFHNGRAYVSYRGKWGVIDKKGNWIFAPVLDWTEELSSEYSPSFYESPYTEGQTGEVNAESGYQNIYGINTEDQPGQLYRFSEGFGVIFKYNMYGFIDTSGKIIASPVYDEVHPFSNGFAAVRHGNFWGYIDKTGKEIIPLQFKLAFSFSKEGLACVVSKPNRSGVSPGDEQTMEYESDESSYYGYINTKGEWVIRPQFIASGSFSEGLARVAISSGKSGYIDRSGKFVIPPKYDLAYDFQSGYALVKLNLFEPVYIDKTGKVSKFYTKDKPPFDKSVPLELKTGMNGRYGFVNEKGEEIIPCQFSVAGNFSRVK
jgi:hypothetical protein